jgi:ParB-like chromosome segregation protein Spo0J
MTEPTEGPSHYSIERLLSQGVQPFPDLPPEDFAVLKEDIRTKGLINPVLLTADGYLFDGHQRLKALLALGRKRISAEHVKVMPKVNRDNMLAHAYASNLVRRHITTEQKAACMHQLVARGWSQRRIAKEMSMSQSAVSQLLAAYPPEGGVPEVIITEGEDGKTYTRMPRGALPKPNKWAHNGESFKTIHRAHRLLTIEVPTGLDETAKGWLAEELDALRDALDKFQDKMESM